MTAIALTLLVLAALVWSGEPAEAQRGGHLQVNRLELRYTPNAGTLDVRYHLASGQAIDERFDDADAINTMLQAAGILAKGGSRMFASIEADRVAAWQLSVP